MRLRTSAASVPESPEQAPDQLGVRGAPQERQVDLGGAGPAQDLAELQILERLARQGLGARGRDDEDRRRAPLLPLEDVEREGEGPEPPLHVVEAHQDGAAGRVALEGPPQDDVPLDGVREPHALRLGRHELDQGVALVGVGDRVGGEEGRDALGGLVRGQAHAGELAREHGPEAVDRTGDGAVDGLPHRPHAALVGPLGDPLREAALAAPRRAPDQHEGGPAVAGRLLQRPPDPVALVVTADQGDGAEAVQTEPGPDEVHRGRRRAGSAPGIGDDERGDLQPQGWVSTRSRVGPQGEPSRDGRHRPGRAVAEGRIARLVGGLEQVHGVHDRSLGQRDGGPELTEQGGRLGGVPRAVLRSLGEQQTEPVLELRGQLPARLEVRRVVDHVGLEQLRVAPREGRGPGRQGPREAPDAVEVGPGPVRSPPAEALLGGHVGRAPEHALLVGGPGDVRDAEVGEAEAPVRPVAVRQEHVAALDVAVQDAAGVRVGEGVEEGHEDAPQRGPGVGAGAGERAAGHELHDEVGAARGQLARGLGLGGLVDLAVVEDGDDAGVAQRRDGADLRPEGRDEVPVVRLVPPQDLDGDVQAGGSMHGPSHDAHAARAEDLVDLEGTQRRDRPGHARSWVRGRRRAPGSCPRAREPGPCRCRDRWTSPRCSRPSTRRSPRRRPGASPRRSAWPPPGRRT